MSRRVISICAAVSAPLLSVSLQGCKSATAPQEALVPTALPTLKKASSPAATVVSQPIVVSKPVSAPIVSSSIPVPHMFENLYEKGLLLGYGNSAQVFDCTKNGEEAAGRFAVKIFNGNKRVAGMNEMRVLAHLTARRVPGVIRLLDSFAPADHERAGQVHLVLPLYERSLLDKTTWNEPEVAKFARDALRIAQGIHRQGVAHMGIGLADLRLTNADDTQVVLSDFENAVTGNDFVRSSTDDVRAIAIVVQELMAQISLARGRVSASSAAFVKFVLGSDKLIPSATQCLAQDWLQAGVAEHYDMGSDFAL